MSWQTHIVRSARLLLPILVAAGCNGGGSPTTPDPVAIGQNLTETLATQHYTFHFAPGDAVDSARQEALHAWVVARLGVSPPTLHYFKYVDKNQMARLTGVSANGWADPGAFAVHSVFPWHAHEAVHVYTALVGRPSDFFNEGIAVAMNVDPLAGRLEGTYAGGVSVDDWARREGDGLLSIPSIVTTSAFRAVPEVVGYQTAGSFVGFLASNYGPERLNAFFAAGSRDDSLARIEADFESAFGVSLADAERAWRRFLGS